MRIESSGRGGAVTGRSAVRAGEGVFSLETRPQAGPAPQAAPAMALGGLGALLALQSVPDPLLARRKALRRGRQLIDALEALRADILAGHIGEGHVNRLLATLTLAREASQPGLDALIDDIELRARVELAKRGIFP